VKTRLYNTLIAKITDGVGAFSVWKRMK